MESVIENFCNKTGCILFDLDGTLLDSAPDIARAGNQLFTAHNYPELPFEKFRPIAGEGSAKFIELGFGYSPEGEELEELKTELFNHYELLNHQNSTLFPGVDEILNSLNETKLPWGIVTSKPERLSLPLLDKFPILNTAHVLVYADTLPKAKPHPDPILFACETINRNPERSIYIGDHERDMIAGKAAGLFVIAAMYGYIIDSKQAAQWPADLYVQSIDELKTIINTLQI